MLLKDGHTVSSMQSGVQNTNTRILTLVVLGALNDIIFNNSIVNSLPCESVMK